MSTPKESNKIFGVELGFKVEKRLTQWVGILIGEVIVIIVVAWLVLIPRFQAVQANLIQLTDNRELLANLQNKLGLIENFNLEFAGRDQLMANIFMTGKDSGLALTAIRQIADQNGMVVSTYRIAPTTLVTNVQPSARAAATAATIDYTEIELTVDGQSERVGPFLKAINESLPLKKVSDLEVSSGSLLATGQSLQLKLRVATYFFPTKVQANALGLIKPFSNANRELANQLAGYAQIAASQTGSEATLGNPNFFGF